MVSLLNFLGTLPGQVWGVSAVMSAIGVTTLIVVLVVWSVAWKGLAMWKAARKGSKVWFVLLLLVNSIGILDIIYIYLVDKKRK